MCRIVFNALKREQQYGERRNADKGGELWMNNTSLRTMAVNADGSVCFPGVVR